MTEYYFINKNNNTLNEFWLQRNDWLLSLTNKLLKEDYKSIIFLKNKLLSSSKNVQKIKSSLQVIGLCCLQK